MADISASAQYKGLYVMDANQRVAPAEKVPCCHLMKLYKPKNEDPATGASGENF